MSRETSTIDTVAKIDVSPEGVKITLPAIDKDIASLIQSASKFTVQPVETHSYDTSNVTILSDRKIAFVDREEV
jgi:hypothetical protein